MTRQDSIRAKGLERHLDSTAGQHNDRGYADFVRLVEDGDEFGEKISLRKLARLFNTTRPTIEKWAMIYEEQKLEIDRNSAAAAAPSDRKYGIEMETKDAA